MFAPLATDRLVLRPLVPEDADALHRLVNDWEVARNLAVVPFPYPRELADDWIRSTRHSLADGSGYQLAITGREGEHEILVGVVGLRVDAGQRVRAARLLGRAALLGAWRRHRGGRPAGALGAGQPRPRPSGGRRDHRQSRPPPPCCAASASAQTGEGTDEFLARGGEHPVWRFEATRDDIFGHAEPAREDPAASRCCWSPPAR